MKEIEKIADELFNKIRSRFEDVSLGDESANSTTDPDEARFFNFDFTVGDTNYGNITVSIADSDSLKVYYSRNISQKITTADKPHWYSFLKSLRFFAKRNMMMFDTRDITRAGLSLRDIKAMGKSSKAYQTSDISIAESKLYGSRTRSYEDHGPARIILRHSCAIDEAAKSGRTRNIESIFVETTEGERFKLPFTNLKGARAMARHIGNGGRISDQISEHICSIVEEMSNLRVFVRNTRGKVFEDTETLEMVESASDYYGELQEKLSKLTKPRTYGGYVANYAPEVHDTSDYDENMLRERFTRKMFDERMSGALSSVHRAYKRKQSQQCDTAMGDEFSEWASSILEQSYRAEIDADNDIDALALEEFFADDVIFGTDATNAISRVSAIINDDGLNNKLVRYAERDPNEDARTVVYSWLLQNNPAAAASVEQTFKQPDTEPNSGTNADAAEPAVDETVDRYDKQSGLLADVVHKVDDESNYAYKDYMESNSLSSIIRLAGL